MTSPDARTDFETRIYQRLTDTVGAEEGTRPTRTDRSDRAEPRRGTRHDFPGSPSPVRPATSSSAPRPVIHPSSSTTVAPTSQPFRKPRSPTPACATRRRTPTASEPSSAPTTRSGHGRSPSPSTRRHGRTDGSAETPVVAVTVDAAARRRRPPSGLGIDRLGTAVTAPPRRRAEVDRRRVRDRAAAGARRPRGATDVRAHAILHDDNHVVRAPTTARWPSTSPRRRDSTTRSSRSASGRSSSCRSCRPPSPAIRSETVFDYRGIISPPRDWTEWRDVIAALAAHLVDRYGIDEVAQWSFEVWNEPNLEVFWTGTQDDYLRLYDESARALKAVDERLAVGGPSTAASEWVERLAAHAENDTRAARLRDHPHVRQPAARRTAGTRPARLRGNAGVVDRVGRRLDALRRDPRQRLRRAVRAQRVRRRAGPDRRARLLGGQRPLRGARPARRLVPQRLRPADGRQPRASPATGRRTWPRTRATSVLAHTVDGDGADGARAGLGHPPRRRHGRRPGLERHGQRRPHVRRPSARPQRPARRSTGSIRPSRTTSTLARIDNDHSNIAAACPTDADLAGRAALVTVARGRRARTEPISRRARSVRTAGVNLAADAGRPADAGDRISAGKPPSVSTSHSPARRGADPAAPVRSTPKTPQQRPSRQPD